MADGRDQSQPPTSPSGDRPSGPHGTPVGSALVVQRLDPDPRGLYDRVTGAIAAIDRVHGDGDLPTIPVEWGRLSAGDEAEIVMPRFGRRLVPQRIVIDPAVRRPGLAILHETGHLLDAQTLGERGEFASASHPHLADWRRVVAGTRAIDALRQLRDASQNPARAAHLDYLLRPDELWGRSYAQHVAARSGDPDVLREVDERRRQSAGSVYIPYIWDDDDFALVATTIDELFGRLGWRIR